MGDAIGIPIPSIPAIPGMETAERMKEWTLKTLTKAKKKWWPPKKPSDFTKRLLGCVGLGLAVGCFVKVCPSSSMGAAETIGVSVTGGCAMANLGINYLLSGQDIKFFSITGAYILSIPMGFML